ncbi:MAG: NADH-quinone oxidoreductase subunit C [Bacteroidales bacterium]|nr:MAG: NADH-quinone oxidoreductase subunit C [Bacteroidales bacterium]
MTFFQSYLLHSISKYIFYIMQRDKKYLTSHSYSNNVSHYYLTTHRVYMQKVGLFLLLDMNSQFKLCVDAVGSDFPSKRDRFFLYYNLLSLSNGLRVFLSCSTNELEKVPSMVAIHSCVSWYEREIWDMYGIHFDGHPDLRRILTDYGFQGHPLRKDFPLSGFLELYYNERLNSIVYHPVSLVQEFRNFDTASPWDYISNY